MNWRKHLVTIVAVAVLVVCLSWLRKVEEARGFLAVNPSFSLVDGRITLREHCLGQYLNGQKVGYTLMRLSEGKDGGRFYHSHVDSQFKLSLLGQEVSFSQISDATLARDLSLHDIRAVFRTLQAQDTVTYASVAGGVLDVTNQSVGQVSSRHETLKGPVYTLEALYPYIVGNKLRPGSSVNLKVFEPTLGSLLDVAIRVIGPREVRRGNDKLQTTLVEMDLLGSTQRSWLDKDGNPVVEETSWGGLAMTGVEESGLDASNLSRGHLRDYAFESTVKEGKALADLFTGTLIDSNVRFAHPEEVFSATYQLSEVPAGSFMADGARQSLLSSSTQEETVRVRVESPAYEALVERFHRAYRLGEDLSRQFAKETAASLRIESDNADVRILARQIVGDQADPYQAALAIQHWLADEANIKKELRATIPDAVEVLSTRSGDCNEHAVLFAALGRAVGLPTKMVTGIVYSPDLGKFGYHAWNEVLVGLDPPTWYALDATLDQTRVDATHVKIAEGEIDQQVAIIPLVGKMKLYVEGYD